MEGLPALFQMLDVNQKRFELAFGTIFGILAEIVSPDFSILTQSFDSYSEPKIIRS